MPASAADVNYSVSSASGKKGDTVTVSVKLSTGVDLWGGIVTLGFNSSELQYVSSSKGGVASSGSLNYSGSTVTYAGQYGGKSGTVFSVSFKILKDSGTSTLSLSSSENIDNNGTTYSVSALGGKVTVKTQSTSTSTSTTKPSAVPVTSVKLNKTTVTLKKGETATLTATVMPNNATNKTVTYTSSNTKVAKVDNNGKITAVGGGKAIITAKADGKTATCTVNVNVAQTGIRANGNTTRKATVGDKIRLSVLKVPADATDTYNTTWTSSDTKIATVASNGTVTAIAPGTVTITAKSNKWTVVYKFTIEEKKTESTTEESSTDESLTDETTDTIIPSETEEPTTEDVSFVEPTTNQGNFLDKLKNPNRYMMTMIIVGAVVAVLIIGVVLILVLKNRSDAKKKEEALEKSRIIVEEKRDR